MNKIRFFVSILILVVILGLGLVFPILNKKANKDNSIQSSEQQTTTNVIKTAVVPLSPLELINQVIVDQKYDREQGFVLKTIKADSGDFLLLLLNKEIDITFTGPLDIVIVGKGKDISMVSSALKMVCPFLVMSSSGIKDFNSMRGKKLGIVKKPVGPYNTLDLAMKSSGLKMTDFFKVTEADLLALPSLLLNGDVDVINTCNILSVAKLLAGNKAKIVDSTEDIIRRSLGNEEEIPAAGVVVRRDWVLNNPTLMKSYINARNKALTYLTSNSSLFASKQYQDKYNLTSEEANILNKLIVDSNYFILPDWKKSVTDINTLMSRANIQPTGFSEENFFLNL